MVISFILSTITGAVDALHLRRLQCIGRELKIGGQLLPQLIKELKS